MDKMDTGKGSGSVQFPGLDSKSERDKGREMNRLGIWPTLVNSASPWATTKDDLKGLYESPYTGAVTVRTSLWEPFDHDSAKHQYAFFDSRRGFEGKVGIQGQGTPGDGKTNSLNSLGYSPIGFEGYIGVLLEMSQEGIIVPRERVKPFIISVTGTIEEVGSCATYILGVLKGPDSNTGLGLLMEINLSCPNIEGKEPPAYDGDSLRGYVEEIGRVKEIIRGGDELKVGIKTPPYTHTSQFTTLIKALESSSKDGKCPIDFITATNTLGSCLVLDDSLEPSINSANGGTGIGGMAGDAIHALSLGNVKIIRRLLDESTVEGVREIDIIGVGGVKDKDGYERMRSVGAGVVGVGTALGRLGVNVFEEIGNGN